MFYGLLLQMVIEIIVIQVKQYSFRKKLKDINMNNITLDEFKDIFKYLIINNKRLVEDGKYPIAIGIEGAAGLGKLV